MAQNLMKDISVEELKQLYSEYNAAEIAELLGVSKNTVYRYLRNYHISTSKNYSHKNDVCNDVHTYYQPVIDNIGGRHKNLKFEYKKNEQIVCILGDLKSETDSLQIKCEIDELENIVDSLSSIQKFITTIK